MKKTIKKVAVLVLIVFLMMQFYQPGRNIDDGKILHEHITQLYPVPNNVQILLKTSCYDCHSNNTSYPWYSYLQPVRFFMDGHIKEGKENLNFSEFGTYSKRKQSSKLEAMSKQVKSDEMPLASYTLIHGKAVLATSQKEELINWANNLKDSLSSQN